MFGLRRVLASNSRCSGRLVDTVRGAIGGISRSVRRVGCGATVTTLVALLGGVCRGNGVGHTRLGALVVLIGPFTPRIARRV